MNIGFHPAPGFGELMPGSFVVPHNPIVPVSYVPRIGELLPAKFSIPENPIVRALSGDNGLQSQGSRTVSMAALAAGCGGISSKVGAGCEGMTGVGMGGLGMGELGDPLSWLPWVIGGTVLFMILGAPGGKDYRAARLRARAKYETELSELRSRYRGYRRAGRSVGRRVSAGLQAAQAVLPPPAK